jgi:hypothetical protein
MPDHGIPLAAILVNWWEQVENDSWSVKASGVDGGEELWKKADTKEDAEDFQTTWSCQKECGFGVCRHGWEICCIV